MVVSSASTGYGLIPLDLEMIFFFAFRSSGGRDMADGYSLLQMNICRQCFREKSQDIGFNKVGFYIRISIRISIPELWNTVWRTSTTVPLRYETGTPLSPFFSFCLFSIHSSSRYVFSDFTLLGAWWSKKKPWEEKADSDLKPEVLSSKWQTDGRGGWKTRKGK